MDFYTVFWREMLMLRRRFLRFFAGSMVSPLLYMVTFAWGVRRGLPMKAGNYLEFVVPGIIALSAMYGSYNTTGLVLNLRRIYYKTFEEYLIAPISPFSLALGNVLAGSVRGIFSSLIILVLAYLFGAHLMINLWFLLCLFLTSFLFASLGLIAAMKINSAEDMINFTTFVILPMSFLCGTFFSVNKLPKAIAYFVEILPLTHASYSLRALALGNDFPLLSLLVLTGYTVALFAAVVIVTAKVE